MRIDDLKYRDDSWDFRGVDTKEYTHCFHVYPAMMIPQIARRLLKEYGIEGGWLLDPYCGTGTSLVEAALFGMNSVGCDINPLVRLIATAKSTQLCLITLDKTLNGLNEELFQIEFRDNIVPDAPIPNIPNLEYWFSKNVIRGLAYLKQRIEKIENNGVRNFLCTAFSETVRETSYTRKGEFKLHRLAPKQLERFEPDVFGTFIKKLHRNRHGLAAFLEKRQNVDTSVSSANTVLGEHPTLLPRGGYDLVITSPPYGDSQTTVAYGQFSRLAAEWLELPNARKIDKLAMGGYPSKGTLLTGMPITTAITKIRAVDTKRAQEVSAFYGDLKQSISTVAKMLRPNATVCYVVGNRRVKGVVLPTDAFIVSAFAQYGFEHKVTFMRSIPNKRMPKRNSPSNVPGETATTMHEEYIVVCQRHITSDVK